MGAMQTPNEQQTALLASLFPRPVSRAEKRRIQILEAAIACYATHGIEDTTYERIAAKCKASRTLIIHYFPDRDDLIRLVFQYIRADMQQAAVEAIQSAKTPEKILLAYVQSTFDWIAKKPDYNAAWMLSYYHCARKKDFKALYTEMTSMGHRRIQAMLSELKGNERVTTGELALRAKSLQSLLTGALVTLSTEDLPLDRATFIKRITQDCLKIAHG